jgi:predicted ArsR family transcriptional regulator
VTDLAQETGLHENTVRNHLEALVALGSVRRKRATGAGRGRPAWEYDASPRVTELDTRVRDYAGLATALAWHISTNSEDPEADAEAAGFVWGRKLAADNPIEDASPEDSRGLVVEFMTELGFDPQGDVEDGRFTLQRCPLLDAATELPEIVCGVHRGLVRGLFDYCGAESSGVALLPFALQDGCVLTLPSGVKK